MPKEILTAVILKGFTNQFLYCFETITLTFFDPPALVSIALEKSISYEKHPSFFPGKRCDLNFT